MPARPERHDIVPSTAEDRPLARIETRPLTARAKEILLDSIGRGAFPDGWLPPEDRLAKQVGVSRTTVRAALRSLEEAGLITRQRGVGTRVNAHVAGIGMSLNRVIGYWDLIRDAGYEPGIAATLIGSGEAPDDCARRLGWPPGEPLLRVERVFTADGNPVVHVVEMIRPDHVVGPLDDMPRSVFEFAEQRCRAKVDYTVVEIVPIVADAAIAAALPLAVGDPLLRLIETHYTVDGVAFIVARIHLVDRCLRFNVVRRRF
jgi:GntR family transcriptional regulator